MDGFSLSNAIWVLLTIIPALFAAYFGYMFYRDGDKRKLMFVLSFSFASISFIEKLLPSTGLFFIEKLYYLGGFPLIFAVLITVAGGLRNFKTFDKPFQIFLAAFSVTVLMVFVPFDYALPRMIGIIGLSFLAICLSAYVSLKKRKMGDVLFLLSIVAFTVAGFGFAFGFGLPFYFLGHVFSFIFIALVFSFATYDTEWSNVAFFKVQQQLTETKKHLKELEIEYKMLFEAANDAIFVADAETGIIVDCNLEAAKLVGRERSEIIGKPRSFLHPPQELDKETPNTFKLHAQGEIGLIETRVITKNGELRDVAIKAGSFVFGGKK